MSSVPEGFTPQFVRNLELTADRAFDLLVKDIMSVENGIYDYPTAAIALDKTGVMELGKGVSTDIRTGKPEAHAEINALDDASSNSLLFNPGIMVATMEACLKICYPEMTSSLGVDGLSAYVMSRRVAEGHNHVKTRQTTDDPSMQGVRSLHLKHPRLQAKGRFLLEKVVKGRDTGTGMTIVNKSVIPSIPDVFASIDAQHPFTSDVYL